MKPPSLAPRSSLTRHLRLRAEASLTPSQPPVSPPANKLPSRPAHIAITQATLFEKEAHKGLPAHCLCTSRIHPYHP
ncbi:hypothetical protein GQ607_004756 [Colletotrichum asianum]|uniref:Uncharacterized protein n=1 Tax=Colletotrichum asianum TaxID=702518 RepID=A0A8H3ZX91_9PEZI|nr:hypothetical protein GQ607_004756 [Colletotrichum asianum]